MRSQLKNQRELSLEALKKRAASSNHPKPSGPPAVDEEEDSKWEDEEGTPDLQSMSHEQHQFLIEQLEKFGKYDKNKSDQATKDDKQFRGLMLHLLG